MIRSLGKGLLGIAAIFAMEACSDERVSTPSKQAVLKDTTSPRANRGIGTYWVGVETSDEYDAPDGQVVNRIYYRQKFTIYEKRGDWYRTVEDGFTPRWSKASDLSPTEPAEVPQYAGPAAYRDARIVPGAIPNPGQYGLTRRDVDTLWKGAKVVLQREAGCLQITVADKSVSKPNTYYVTCRIGGMPTNIFFTRAEVESAS